MTANELAATATALVAPGKGILAADESSGTIAKRFESIQVESTTERRRAYRELLFTTEGAAEFISGVILYDETLRQQAADGRSLAQVLSGQGIICGIKVDAGTTGLAGFPPTGTWGPGSPSGGRSSPSASTSPPRAASGPTPRPWPASPPSPRRPG